MTAILDFGKYKGQSIEEVFEKDASYCRWLYNQETLIEIDSEIKSYLHSKIQDPDDDSYLMRWGKYKSKTIKWIYENDKKYFGWLSHNEYVSKKCPSLSKDLVRVKQSYESAA